MQEASGVRGSAGNQTNVVNGKASANNIRRYLVLLHDCLAIKFVPEREPFNKANNDNFPNCSSSSLADCSSCNCSTYDTARLRAGGNLGNNECGKSDNGRGGCSTTGATSLANNPCDDGCNRGNPTRSGCSRSNDNYGGNKGRKHDWKSNQQSNHHSHQKTRSNEEANDRGDHHECQFYRHQANQANYPHDSSTQSHLHHQRSSSSSSLLKANNDNNDSEIRSPTGDQVSHQIQPLSIVNNKSNKVDPPSRNKGDYEVVEHGRSSRCACSNNSRNCGHWESGQLKHHHQQNNGLNSKSDYLKKPQQQSDPTHEYSPQAYNEHLSHPHQYIAKGASMNKDDSGICLRSNNNACRIKPGHLNEGGGTNSVSILSKVDHSMQALFLYKEFQAINLSFFWNSAVHEAFKNLEYKGSVVPSTILVGSPIRKHLNVLKTAWSRKMLRSPAGYTIEFLGEVEELIADPIAKSHFVPLADSLCWAIHELTSSGQEAFVDDIFLNLASAFPGMALPTKELIYQTLEKLTRERKTYQTAQGYFVVTPDTHRYIMSTEPLLMQTSSAADYQANITAANFLRNTILFQQASMLNTPVPSTNQEAIESQQDKSNQEQTERDNVECTRDETEACPSPDPDTYSLPYGTFRRYNSLRIRKDASGKTGCLPRRTLSMRLPKSKSKKNGCVASNTGSGSVDQAAKRADVTGSFQNLDDSQPSTVNKQLLSRRRKHKSFLSRLLSFRGVRKNSGRKDKSGRNSVNATNKAQPITQSDKSSKGLINFDSNSVENSKKDKNMQKSSSSSAMSPSAGNACEERLSSSNNLATTSTQTSFSIENLNADLTLLSLAGVTSKSSTLEREDSDSGRCTDSHSDADAEITAALNRGLTPTIHDHHHHLPHHHNMRRDMVGRSHSSCNVYEKIENNLGLKVDVDDCDGRSPRSPSSQMSVSPSPSIFTTASAIYSNRGNHPNLNRQNLYSRCHSSASSSGYSYRDFYNLYRRRYPSYQQSTPTSLESSEINEGLRFRPQQPIRYPPRSFERKQIFDEISRGSFKEKKRGNTVTITSNVCDNDNNGKLSRAGQHQHRSSESILLSNNRTDNVIQPRGETNDSVRTSTTTKTTATTSGSAPMTTILSQTIKNTTNMELEFRLPLGNILSAALGSGRNATMNVSSSKLSSERSEPNESESRREEHHQQRTTGRLEERECLLNEVDTTVNDLFTIKSFVKTNPLNDELSSTIEFKTRGSSSCNNSGNGQSNNNNASHNTKTTYVIEAVSSKPFADIHTKMNRESEII